MVLINKRIGPPALDTATVETYLTLLRGRLAALNPQLEAEPDNLTLWGRAFELTNQIDNLTIYLETGALVL